MPLEKLKTVNRILVAFAVLAGGRSIWFEVKARHSAEHVVSLVARLDAEIEAGKVDRIKLHAENEESKRDRATIRDQNRASMDDRAAMRERIAAFERRIATLEDARK